MACFHPKDGRVDFFKAGSTYLIIIQKDSKILTKKLAKKRPENVPKTVCQQS